MHGRLYSSTGTSTRTTTAVSVYHYGSMAVSPDCWYVTRLAVLDVSLAKREHHKHTFGSGTATQRTCPLCPRRRSQTTKSPLSTVAVVAIPTSLGSTADSKWPHSTYTPCDIHQRAGKSKQKLTVPNYPGPQNSNATVTLANPDFRRPKT